MIMNNMPKKLREECAEDPFYHVCARKGLHSHECAGRVTWEHALVHAGKQVQSKNAVIPLCEKAHNCGKWQDCGDMSKEINVWIALNRMEDSEILAISKARDYFLHRAFLNKKYGPYEIVRQPSISGIQYPWLREEIII